MKIFTKSCCEQLLSFISTSSKSKYFTKFSSDDFEFLNIDNGIEVPSDTILDTSNKKELENSILIFETFKTLDRVQANDKRFWVTLSHTYFFDYTQKRWNIGVTT